VKKSLVQRVQLLLSVSNSAQVLGGSYFRGVGLEGLFAKSSALLIPTVEIKLFGFIHGVLSGILSLSLEQWMGPGGPESYNHIGGLGTLHGKFGGQLPGRC
jgi:hypothetical protein